MPTSALSANVDKMLAIGRSQQKRSRKDQAFHYRPRLSLSQTIGPVCHIRLLDYGMKSLQFSFLDIIMPQIRKRVVQKPEQT
jgi:hypothetical protein